MSDQFTRDDQNRSTDTPFGAVNTPSAPQPSSDAPVPPSADVPPVQPGVPTPPPVPPVTPYVAPQPASQPTPSTYPPVPPQPVSAPTPSVPPVTPSPAAPQAPYTAPQAPYAAPGAPTAPPQAPVPPQPPVYQPPYAAAPGYYAPMQPVKKTNGFAVASLVCGILAIPTFCCLWLPILLGVLAIVFGILSRRQDNRVPGAAVAGIICGAIGLVLAVLCVVGYYTGNFNWVLEDYDDWMYDFEQYAMIFRR